MGRLQDKVIVITGSSRGLGLAAARACAAEGAQVVLSARSDEAVRRAVADLAAAGLAATGRPCDVSQREQVEALAAHAVAAFGRFDVWINNAGYAPPYGPTVSVPPDGFLRAVQTNVLGTYYGSVVALSHFLPRGRGKLINILGRGDRGDPSPLQNGYASSKAWVRSFTRTLAREYRKTGVGIFAFNPGMMSTDFLTRLEAVAGYEGRLKVMPTIIRMWSNPPEVPAARLVWLASAATDGRTGLELHQMNGWGMLGGALREGWLRLRGRRPRVQVDVVSVPPATR